MERRFFMNYPVSDKLHQGFLSRYLQPEIPDRSDIVIALEHGLLPHRTFGDVDVIDIASDPFHRQDVYAGGDYGASIYAALIRAVCDSNATLQKITKIGSTISSSEKRTVSEHLARYESIHDQKFSEWRQKARQSYESGRLDNWSVGYVLNKHATENSIWVNGTASSWETLLRTFEMTRSGSVLWKP